MSKWYERPAAGDPALVSTRVRLARNLKGIPFPAKATLEEKLRVSHLVEEVLRESQDALKFGFKFIDMDEIPPVAAMALAEQHLISPAFAKMRAGRGLLLSEDQSLCIMLGEEDHIRIQALLPGGALAEAFELASRIDDILCGALEIAFDKQLGFLTQCPTNLGTGMRASLMLHLPILEQNGALAQIAPSLAKIGLAFRGTYGEGSGSRGGFYQLSNQITLGISEQAAIQNLTGIADQIIEQEHSARQPLAAGETLNDRVWRALAVLRNARILPGEEFMELISHVRLGVGMGLADTVSMEQITALINQTGPATLIDKVGRELDSTQRDIMRAKLVRETLQ